MLSKPAPIKLLNKLFKEKNMNQSFIQMTQLLFHNHPYVATLITAFTLLLSLLIIKATRRFKSFRNKMLFGFTMASVLYHASTQLMSYINTPEQFGYNIILSYISISFTMLLYFTIITWTMKTIVNTPKRHQR